MFGENSTLTEIAGPGVPDRSGDVDTAGAAVWTGRVPAVLTRRRRRALTAGGMTLIETDVLHIPHPHRQLLAVFPGDQETATTIVVRDRRSGNEITRRFRVVGVEHHAEGTLIDSLRLELDDERSS